MAGSLWEWKSTPLRSIACRSSTARLLRASSLSTGRAEVRVRPTRIRIVLAATSEGKTAQDCQRAIQESVTGLKSRWQKLKVAPENIVEDFIAVLPVHEWNVEKRGDSEVGVEQRVGFRMQTNIHLSVPNDETATAALSAAFEQGIADIIAVDYWSPELDAAKVRRANWLCRPPAAKRTCC